MTAEHEESAQSLPDQTGNPPCPFRSEAEESLSDTTANPHATLFSAADPEAAREYVTERAIPNASGLEIFYTGTELRRDDLQVTRALLHLARSTGTAHPVRTTAGQLASHVSLPDNQAGYRHLLACLGRLTAHEIKFRKTGAGQRNFYAGSIVNRYIGRPLDDGDTSLTIHFDARIVTMLFPPKAGD